MPPPERETRNLVAPADEATVQARDAAVLNALKLRTWTTDGLMTVLPQEPGQTVDQRKTALSSALIRLRLKKRIQAADGETWSLA